MQDILNLQSISVSLPSKGGQLSILKDISLTISRGKMIAVVGPSGSGKTTLLMACAGLIPISNGNILFEGQKLSLDKEQEMTKWRQKNVGIIFQNFHLLPSQTALENTKIPLELRHDKDANKQATLLLEKLGLGHRLDHLPSALSGGEQQRVALARAMIGNPPILLADEPTGNLDQENGERVMSLIEEQVRNTGTTLILITHDLQIAAKCDEQIHLLDGHISKKVSKNA